MANPFIRLGVRMKTWLLRIIIRDFGEEVSYPKGLYNILTLYEKYVPKSARRNMNGGKRVPYKRKWI